ncbi:MAG: hypothetical protein UD159_06735 [Faecalibacterium prausnitzii]|nr:hypothetical protein [Faecalibacterium prausnitzii]
MFHVEHPEPKKTTAKTRREAKEFEKIERGEAKSANAGPFSRKIIKNRVQKAALMCYTKEQRGPQTGKRRPDLECSMWNKKVFLRGRKRAWQK